MAAPTLTGTAAGTAQTTAITIDVTMTVPADANMILVGFGGYANAAIGVSSVQGDPDGTPYDLDDLTLWSQSGTAQYSGLYGIDDQNVNWPGTGSVTVRVSLSGADSTRQLKAGICCVKDVNTSGTYQNGTQTGTGSSSAPSLSVTSTTNALDIAVAGTYSADVGGGDDTVIYEEQNSTTSSSLYMWHEAGAASSNTIEGNASVSWAAVAVSLEGTSSGTEVSANTDTYTLTTYSASINAETSVSASTATLTLSEHSANIGAGSNITAATQALTLSTYAASINADTSITASTAGLTLTGYAATISSTLEGVSDSFDGSGALGSHWLTYQSSVQTVERVSGYLEADVDDNTSDVTLWFDGDRGRMDYQRVQFPTEAIPNEYVFYNIGVGPTSNPRNNLSYDTNQFSFAGLILHDANTANNNYMFSVVGHRGSSAQATIEIKSTASGTSYVDDEGTDVFGAGVTHGDLAVELRNDGSAKFKYKDVSSSTWTYINSGTGLTPGAPTNPPNLGSAGDEVLVGFIAYAYTLVGVPWIGSAESFTAFEGEFSTATLGLTTYPATITTPVNVSASTEALTLTTHPATVDDGQNVFVSANTAALTLTENQATVTKNINVQAATGTLTLSVYQSAIKADVSIVAANDSLTLVEQQSSVSLDKSVTANTQNLSLVASGATITATTAGIRAVNSYKTFYVTDSPKTFTVN